MTGLSLDAFELCLTKPSDNAAAAPSPPSFPSNAARSPPLGLPLLTPLHAPPSPLSPPSHALLHVCRPHNERSMTGLPLDAFKLCLAQPSDDPAAAAFPCLPPFTPPLLLLHPPLIPPIPAFIALPCLSGPHNESSMTGLSMDAFKLCHAKPLDDPATTPLHFSPPLSRLLLLHPLPSPLSPPFLPLFHLCRPHNESSMTGLSLDAFELCLAKPSDDPAAAAAEAREVAARSRQRGSSGGPSTPGHGMDVGRPGVIMNATCLLLKAAPEGGRVVVGGRQQAPRK